MFSGSGYTPFDASAEEIIGGWLTPETLTGFSAQFTGDPLIGNVSFGDGALIGFVYMIGDAQLGDDTRDGGDGIEAQNGRAYLVLGPGPASACDGGSVCGILDVPTVAAPPSIALGALGGSLLGVARRGRRAA